ncbi:reverse transcriptase domain-containing protein [Tanacetum coccineum]
MTIIGTKLVERNMLDENGVVSRKKARLVAQGYNQQEGIDYDETYTSVARSLKIVKENPNHLNEPNEAIPKVNPVIPEPNHVEDAHDPNEMVDIPDDEELVDYNEDDEEEPKEEPKEEPEEEPEPNNGHGNQFAQHPNPQPCNMNG